VPGAIVVLVAGTVAAVALALPVETIASRFGGMRIGLPPPRISAFRPDLFLSPLSPALTVAMLGAIESLMSAVVADRMSGDRHQPNVELVAQGIANVASPLFGGLPATGAIARTATNIRSGARTPVAGMVHAATLLLILLFLAPLAARIPMAVLAGILGSTVTYFYGPEGKHGANYMQTAAASVASMAAMGVLLQAMVWLGVPEPSVPALSSVPAPRVLMVYSVGPYRL
jgi:MFS superfamily sulfate permease-like transporter